MSIKKKLGMSTVAATLGISLIGRGTYGYFNDTEVTNNTFAAGTLDIHLKDADASENNASEDFSDHILGHIMKLGIKRSRYRLGSTIFT